MPRCAGDVVYAQLLNRRLARQLLCINAQSPTPNLTTLAPCIHQHTTLAEQQAATDQHNNTRGWRSRMQRAACPVCDSTSRQFICHNCINNQCLQQRQQGANLPLSLKQCLAQAEQLRQHRQDLLQRLEEHLAARVRCGAVLIVHPSIQVTCMRQQPAHSMKQSATLLALVALCPCELNCLPLNCPLDRAAGSIPAAAGVSMEEGSRTQGSTGQG